MKNILLLILGGLLSLNTIAQNHVFDWANNNGNSSASAGFSVTTDYLKM